MSKQKTFEFEKKAPIKGYPELHWTGKRPYTSTQYYPAQLKESYGEPKDGWINKIFWGDNLQVMSHMLNEFRGEIDLVYIDPPFDSKADYKKKIKLKGKKINNDTSSFEEKQYGDIWTNDEYLQFMYERLTIIRDLMKNSGTIFLHCDWHKSHHLRMLMDEVFGSENFIDEIVWGYEDIGSKGVKYFKRKHDTILMYSKTSSDDRVFNPIRKTLAESTIKRYQPYFDENGIITYKKLKETNPGVFAKLKGIPEDLNQPWLDMYNGAPISDWWEDKSNWWVDISALKNGFDESTSYPTQKPEALLERIIYASSNPGDIVFDCFMGSGTTQTVAMKMGRRFLGTDINLGAVQTTTKRLLNCIEECDEECYTGLEVYNVNNYDFFKNPIEAKELLMDALGIQKYDSSSIYDGEMDGYMVKIMPTNRIATKADLEELKAILPYKKFEKRKEEHPNIPVEKIRIICMGHEADLKASFEQDLSNYNLEIDIVDVLRDKSDLQFKRESDARIVKENGKLIIKEFYPMNLLQKLSMQKDEVDDWKQMVESIVIDWDYDGEVMKPKSFDIPNKKELVRGEYDIPSSAKLIKVKITDLLSESLEVEV